MSVLYSDHDGGNQESYEMVNSSQFHNANLERGVVGSEDGEPNQDRDLDQEPTTSASTRSSSDKSVSSQTSKLLFGINKYSDYNNNAEDFTSSEGFLRTKGGSIRKKICVLITIAFIGLWSIGAIGYAITAEGRSNSVKKPYRPTYTDKSTYTFPAVSPTRSAIPLIEYDIHPSRDPIPTDALKGDVLLESISFLDSGSLDISKEADEGFYISEENGVIELKKFSKKTFSQVLHERTEFLHDGHNHYIDEFIPNYNLTHAIVLSGEEAKFRHSTQSYYWIMDLSTQKYDSISKDGKETMISAAKWSPRFNYITFIQDNNLFVYDVKHKNSTQITKDGSANIFNGKTDWIYEEEVLATDTAFWWSLDESNLVYMRIDDTNVEEQDLEFFVSDEKYPKIEKLKYPKPGGSNPITSLHNYDLLTGESKEIDRSGSTLGKDSIVYGCQWLDGHNLIIRETDRESKILDYRCFDARTSKSRVIHKVDAVKEYNGWIEKFSDMYVIPKNESAGRPNIGFIDTVVVDGYNHLGYFEFTEENVSPKPLTSGDWEVTSGVLAFDKELNLIYFTSNRRSSLENHLYSLDLFKKEMKVLTDTSDPTYYSASFSPSSRHVFLLKDGPNFPLMYGKDRAQKRGLVNFMGEEKTFHKVKVDEDKAGNPITVNVIEVRPKNFKENETHPLLVSVYGGPGSQKLSAKFSVYVEDGVSQDTNAVILYIDPRGTGGQGWKYRAWAREKIGYWEPRDITKATKTWIDAHPYIDDNNTAIWGWSYGGFTTLKTLEYDAGEVFKYGIAVAPVTDWTLYDSIYTERYMGQPKNNKDGYKESRVNNVDAFKSVRRFLVMHGTGDDNVHVQNSLRLFDKFNLANVMNYDMKIFPDSNHSIYFHNANAVISETLRTWFTNAFQGRFNQLIY